MTEVLEAIFSLLPGFAYFHIVIWGMIGTFIAAFLSGVLWFARDEIARALPGGAIVLGLPVLVFAGVPGAGKIGVPILLLAAGAVLIQHLRAWASKRENWIADAGLAVLTGASLLAIAFPYIMSIGS